MNRILTLGSLLGVFAFSACNCGLPFGFPVEHVIEGQVAIELGGDDDCAHPQDAVLDADGNATTQNGSGTIWYHYELDANAGTCTLIIDRWEGVLANTEGTKEQIDEQVTAAGLDPDAASVEITEVQIDEVVLTLHNYDDSPFPMENTGPYSATVNAVGGDARVDALLVINHAAGGDASNPDITTSEDTTGLGSLVNAAVFEDAALGGDGEARIQVNMTDMPELTGDGQGRPYALVQYKLRITGMVAPNL
jgi:hypothetical protein